MNTIHIFHIKHREKIPEEIFRKYLLLLPEDFQKDINAYKHWENALSSLLGKMLLLYGFKKLNLPYVTGFENRRKRQAVYKCRF